MYLKKLVNSMPSRLPDIISREGNPAKYWQEGFTHNGPFSGPKINTELVKSTCAYGFFSVARTVLSLQSS
jgi:hypothetical protein